ncbi:CLUMA_CG019707, isoform A [Clunio marinus]|uniref:CLUMA_CG019707, isoform A n=1 Tax=Clunio marinus TaxID=568069 RepID=A0A1J1J2Q5_9DIPT|nr:CLUMA_CG019707, isoform A [Clunio marinus]
MSGDLKQTNMGRKINRARYHLMGGQTVKVNLRRQNNMIICTRVTETRRLEKETTKSIKDRNENIHLQLNEHEKLRKASAVRKIKAQAMKFA